jgi:ureidoglycolate hydrolase
MKSDLIEIKEYNEPGYKPVIDYDQWRVAVLNYCDELLPENIDKMQKHNQTDEVFVLLKGECMLFMAEGDQEIEEIHAQKMEPYKMYNIKRSVWHTHTLSKEAEVLIVENRNTGLDNSPEIELTEKERKRIIELSLDFD